MDLVGEALDKHTQAEVISYLNSVMKSVLKEYRVAVEKNEPEVLFSCLGDISLVSDFLAEMKKQEDLRNLERTDTI